MLTVLRMAAEEGSAIARPAMRQATAADTVMRMIVVLPEELCVVLEGRRVICVRFFNPPPA